MNKEIGDVSKNVLITDRLFQSRFNFKMLPDQQIFLTFTLDCFNYRKRFSNNFMMNFLINLVYSNVVVPKMFLRLLAMIIASQKRLCHSYFCRLSPVTQHVFVTK